MKKLLLHISTQDELIAYLTQKMLQRAQMTEKDFVVA